MTNPDKTIDGRQQKQTRDGSQPLASQSLTRRSIRSFVIRNGRITDAQKRALDELLPLYGLPYNVQSAPASSGPCTGTENLNSEGSKSEIFPSINPAQAFGKSAPLWIETGFGNGDALLHMGTRYPDVNVLGIEVHAAGVGHALRGIDSQALKNIRVIQHDAVEVLQHSLPAQCAERVLLFFPDPWHKKRHHKRRIVQQDFLDAVAGVLQTGGLLHCATDWEDYATWMLEHIEADRRFSNQAGVGGFSERPEWRPATRFEARGRRLGHQVYDLIFQRTDVV